MVVKLDAKDAIRSTVTKLRQYLSLDHAQPLNEANTKAAFVDKYITALGYEGLEDIVREYYVKNSQEFIDYVLRCQSKAVLAIEAKPLHSDLTDKHAAQLVAYCAVEGIEWSALTNGRELRLFNQYIKGDLQSKQVLKLDLLAFNSDEEYDAIFEQLWLLSKESMSTPTGIKTWLEQRRLDRSIRAALLNPASLVVNTLRKQLLSTADLKVTPEAIVQWVRSQLTPNVVTLPLKAEPPVDKIDPEKEPVVTAIYGLDYYMNIRPPALAKDFWKLCGRVEDLVNQRGWNLRRHNQKGYVPFKNGFFVVFGVNFLGKGVSLWFRVPEDVAKQTQVEGHTMYRYYKALNQAEYKIDEGDVDLAPFAPLFEAAYKNIVSKKP